VREKKEKEKCEPIKCGRKEKKKEGSVEKLLTERIIIARDASVLSLPTNSG
jgi:hypothetical protein